uniref:Uncharacterized protein n=1 Tax=Anguilla anguilla TaxID=7936 RepID=A0A0E9WK55_ANGAN
MRPLALLTLAYRAMNDTASPDIQTEITSYSPTNHLHSSSFCQLAVPFPLALAFFHPCPPMPERTPRTREEGSGCFSKLSMPQLIFPRNKMTGVNSQGLYVC